MTGTPDAWWRTMPFAVKWNPTDVCHGCGHTRDRHVRDRASKISKRVTERCLVVGCECGPILNRYHIAGWVGTKDTITARDEAGSPAGIPVIIDQPMAPRRPIKD